MTMKYSHAVPSPDETDKIRRRLWDSAKPPMAQPVLAPDSLYANDAAHNARVTAAPPPPPQPPELELTAHGSELPPAARAN